jgi:hypothetical protein
MQRSENVMAYLTELLTADPESVYLLSLQKVLMKPAFSKDSKASIERKILNHAIDTGDRNACTNI